MHEALRLLGVQVPDNTVSFPQGDITSGYVISAGPQAIENVEAILASHRARSAPPVMNPVQDVRDVTRATIPGVTNACSGYVLWRSVHGTPGTDPHRGGSAYRSAFTNSCSPKGN